MKNLLICLAVIVYLNNGKVFSYSTGRSVGDNRETGGLFDNGRAPTILYVCTDQNGYCRFNASDRLAGFTISSVERWEIK